MKPDLEAKAILTRNFEMKLEYPPDNFGKKNKAGGKEYTPKDQYCADRGTFIIENLCNLKTLAQQTEYLTANTYPMNYADMSGLPCRVVAEV